MDRGATGALQPASSAAASASASGVKGRRRQQQRKQQQQQQQQQEQHKPKPPKRKPSADQSAEVSRKAPRAVAITGAAAAKKGAVDKERPVAKRAIQRAVSGPTHLYVSRNSDFKAQLARAHKLLADPKHKSVTVHGLGAAINRAINLALQLSDQALGGLDVMLYFWFTPFWRLQGAGCGALERS